MKFHHFQGMNLEMRTNTNNQADVGNKIEELWTQILRENTEINIENLKECRTPLSKILISDCIRKKHSKRKFLAEKFQGKFLQQWKVYQENVELFQNIYGINIAKMIEDESYKKNIIIEKESKNKHKIIRIADLMYQLDLL